MQINLNHELYKKIADAVINPNLNKVEAKNQLASILDEYRVTRNSMDPEYYDLRNNIKLFLKDKKRQGLSPITIDNYQLHLKIFVRRTEELQELLGHDDIQTTGIYAKQTFEHKQQSYAQFFHQ